MAKIRHEVEAAGATRATRDFAKAMGEIDKEAGESAKSLTRAERAARRFSEQADPAERFQRKMRDIAEAVRDGGLEQEKALILVERHGRALDRAGDSGRLAFDPGIVTRWAASIAGPAALIQQVVSGFQAVRQEQERLAAEQGATATSRGALFQLAGDDRALAAQLTGAADTTFGEGFVRSRDDANALSFQLGSSGALKDRGFFSRLAVIDNAAELARAAGLIRKNFEGVDDVGTSQDIVSKALAAALPATGVSASDIAAGVSRAAPAARPFGLTDEEVTAAVGIVSERTGDALRGGTFVASLFNAATKQGLAEQARGQGIGKLIGSINSRNFRDPELIKFLGTAEGQKAFAALSDDRTLGSAVKRIQRAASEGLAEGAIDNALGDNIIAAEITRRGSEASLTLSRDAQAAATQRSKAFQAAINQADEAAGVPRVLVQLGNRFENLLETFLGTDQRFFDQETTQNMIDALDRNTDALNRSESLRAE